MTLGTLNYGNDGIFLLMGHAGFCPSTVVFGIISESLSDANFVHASWAYAHPGSNPRAKRYVHIRHLPYWRGLKIRIRFGGCRV